MATPGTWSYVGVVAKVEMYVTSYCPYCVAAKQLLHKKGVAFSEIDVTGDDDKRTWLRETTGLRTVPQIFIDDRPYGGYTDIAALDRRGELDHILGLTARESVAP